MQTKAEAAFVDALIEENRELRDTIRELIREQIETENYWKDFVIKVVQKGSAA